MTNDPRIDAYIDKAQPFAKPILVHLRKLVHQASPEITETIKWGAPFFEYKGILGGMAAFKQHCAFNFMKSKLMKDVESFNKNNGEGKGHLGRIESLGDLPPDEVMIGYLREAIKLNEDNVKPEKKKLAKNKELVYPTEMLAALDASKNAKGFFEAMSYSNKKDYTEWIAEAKTEATRNKRIITMIEWLEEGKTRNWKYQK